MLGWSILFGVLAFLLLLLLIPIRARITFDEELKIRAYYGCIPIYRYPSKRPEKPKPQKAEKAPKAEKAEKKKSRFGAPDLEAVLKEEGVMGLATYLRELARLTATSVRHILAAIVVDREELQIVVATGDAAETALLYGKLCGVLYPAQAVLERFVRIKRRQLEIAPQFTLEKGYVKGRLKLHAIPLRLLAALLMIAVRWIRTNHNPTIKETAKNG